MRAVIAVAVALVALRLLLYLLFEQVSFDSDQAIVGLMAKHLAEGRAFPLFFYGQTYMLGVESWTAAPFVAIAGPTVGALRMSILAWNVAAAVLLIKALERNAGLSRWTALAPALFFVAAPLSIANMLAWAQGGVIEPFVYVVILWLLRDRPLWFGAVLALGFLNREFTLYAVPVLLVVDALTARLTWERARAWLASMVAFFIVWESIEALKRFADLSGPGTRGQLIGGFSGSQVGNLLARFDWQPGELADRVTRLTPDLFAWFIGAGQVDTDFPLADRRWLAWIVAAAVILLAARLVVLVKRTPHAIERAPFAWYLLGVGLLASIAFIVGKPRMSGYARYATLGLLTPVGLTASMLALEWRPAVRRLVVAATIAWAALMVVDHSRVLIGFLRHPPPNPSRAIADRLVARHVDVAEAGYWDAYLITFLARERVRVASQDFIRVDEYQQVAAERSPNVTIRDEPCRDGERIGNKYLCGP